MEMQRELVCSVGCSLFVTTEFKGVSGASSGILISIRLARAF
jgi:hypothetical protein